MRPVHSIDGPFALRHQRLAARPFLLVAGQPERLEKSEVAPELAEPDAGGSHLGQPIRLLLVLPEIDLTQHADTLAQFELTPRLGRFVLEKLRHPRHRVGMRNQGHRDDALLGAPHYGLVAD